MSRHYTESYKRESVHYGLSHPEKSKPEIAKELGIPYGTFKEWFRGINLAEYVSQTAIPKTAKELEQENKKLKRELELKGKEVELLKKFNVYLARMQD
jgi:transposase-like protein